MGNIFSSSPAEPAPLTDTPESMPDFNNLFQQGVPKMMQVADDMHRMTDYMKDLRNMLIGLALLSVFGVLMFLILKWRNDRRSGHGRKRIHESNSGHSTISNMTNHPYRDENSEVELIEHHPTPFVSKVP